MDTHTQTNHCNPRCTCAPTVNKSQNVNMVIKYIYTDICELLDLCKSKQGNTTNLNISFTNEKELLRWDPNPPTTYYGMVDTPSALVIE